MAVKAEKPILFSAPMVRAIIEGRKTQTRRICKPAMNEVGEWADAVYPDGSGKGWIAWWGKGPFSAEDTARRYPGNEGFRAPYWPGLMLWVRETWGVGCRPDPRYGGIDGLEFRADADWLGDERDVLPLYPFKEYGGGFDPPDDFESDAYAGNGWRPSIFMPRWASRITLEVVSVRAERVQEIGRDGRKAHDVLAEGITPKQIEHWAKWLHPDDAPAHTFGELWNSINGKKPGLSWAANPWVWVYEFKVLEAKP